MSEAFSAQSIPAPTADVQTDSGPTDEEIRSAWQQPLVLGLAAAIAIVTLLQLGLDAHGVIGAGFAATLVILAAIDIEYRVIPNKIVLPAAAAVLVLQVAFYPDSAGEWVGASFGAALFLFLPLLVFPAGLGMGDVKLALLLGAMLGRDVIPALLVGFLSLWPVAIYLIAMHGWEARKEKVPLGPSLAFGGILVLLLSG
jgi:leader peptidase (prepilin peptidase) / N-methyltransferase